MADQQQFQIQVNTERLKNTRVHFCIPCYGGMLTEQTFMSFIKWGNTARQLGIEWAIETMNNESLISRGRNTLAAKFLNNAESTHLMFIDADIGWEPWHLLALIDRDVDVIGGLYPMKTMPIKWVVNGFEGAEQGEDGLQEVSKTGTGFMLIKRQVFDMDRRRFADTYARFKSGQQETISGTPLSSLVWMSESRVKEYEFFNITTLEQLAEAADGAQAGAVMGFVEDKQKAQAYLAAAQGNALNAEVQTQLEARDRVIEKLQAQVEELNSKQPTARAAKG